jgi:hypothetical protein
MPKSLEWCLAQDDDMPPAGTVWHWVATDPEFKAMFYLAKECQADLIAEECIAIADDDSRDGDNPQAVQRARVRIETRKWTAGKLRPKRWGDKLDVSLEGNLNVTMFSALKAISEEDGGDGGH